METRKEMKYLILHPKKEGREEDVVGVLFIDGERAGKKQWIPLDWCDVVEQEALWLSWPFLYLIKYDNPVFCRVFHILSQEFSAVSEQM